MLGLGAVQKCGSTRAGASSVADCWSASCQRLRKQLGSDPPEPRGLAANAGASGPHPAVYRRITAAAFLCIPCGCGSCDPRRSQPPCYCPSDTGRDHCDLPTMGETQIATKQAERRGQQRPNRKPDPSVVAEDAYEAFLMLAPPDCDIALDDLKDRASKLFPLRYLLRQLHTDVLMRIDDAFDFAEDLQALQAFCKQIGNPSKWMKAPWEAWKPRSIGQCAKPIHACVAERGSSRIFSQIIGNNAASEGRVHTMDIETLIGFLERVKLNWTSFVSKLSNLKLPMSEVRRPLKAILEDKGDADAGGNQLEAELQKVTQIEEAFRSQQAQSLRYLQYFFHCEEYHRFLQGAIAAAAALLEQQVADFSGDPGYESVKPLRTDECKQTLLVV
eukprot:g31677.t1